MSDKRIIELDVTDIVEDDDFLAIDSVSGNTRRIKPIKIGATYEIEDGDHEFTLIGSNGYEHTVHLPVDAVSMTQAEYDALTPEQKADGTTRFITDAPSDVESELWSKVGRQTLDTDSQVLSNAVNELRGDIDTNTDDINTNTEAISELESRMVKKETVSLTFDNSGRSTIQHRESDVVAVELQSTDYTYTLRYLNSTQCLIYLRQAGNLSLVTTGGITLTAIVSYL